jgi:hypothetical protein
MRIRLFESGRCCSPVSGPKTRKIIHNPTYHVHHVLHVHRGHLYQHHHEGHLEKEQHLCEIRLHVHDRREKTC